MNPEGRVLSFIARYALKSRRRFAGGVLDPGGYIQIEYGSHSKDSDLNRLNHAHFLNRFNKIRKDYDRLKLCLYMLKIIHKTSLSGAEGDPELFHLLGNSLLALEQSQNLSQLKILFEIRFLFLQGVLPASLQKKNIFLETAVSNHENLKRRGESISDIQKTVKESLHEYLGESF